MRPLTRVAEMQLAAAGARALGQRIGFVPTMGAIHEGHLSLVREARRGADLVVASVFVNPTQFGPQEDFASYPRDLARDSERLAAEGVDLLFAPPVEEIYPLDFQTYVNVEGLSQQLEGAHRPGHFRGVSTVVLKLFNIVQPHLACFGRKDAQQAALVQQMVCDLHLPVEILVCPIVREPDGLAMSSRNAYLSPPEHQAALVLYRALRRARELLEQGERESNRVLEAMRAVIAAEPRARLEYAAAADAVTFQPRARIEGDTYILLAVGVGPARLIDNLLVEERAGRLSVHL